MNDNLRILFEKASENSELMNSIIGLYREHPTKEEIIKHLIILAADYDVTLTPEDFRKQSESDVECSTIDSFAEADITECIPKHTGDIPAESTPNQKKSFFSKLFGKKQ